MTSMLSDDLVDVVAQQADGAKVKIKPCRLKMLRHMQQTAAERSWWAWLHPLLYHMAPTEKLRAGPSQGD